MDDKPNFQVRKQLDRKLPGEQLTLDEIRELKKKSKLSVSMRVSSAE